VFLHRRRYILVVGVPDYSPRAPGSNLGANRFFFRKSEPGTSTQPCEDKWGVTWKKKAAATAYKTEINGLGNSCVDHAISLHPQKLALTFAYKRRSSVGIVACGLKATEFVFLFVCVFVLFPQVRIPTALNFSIVSPNPSHSLILHLLTYSALKNSVSWDVTPCVSCKNRCFGGKFPLHHQGENNQRTNNNVCSNWQLKHDF
jgi:hypothetical protein